MISDEDIEFAIQDCTDSRNQNAVNCLCELQRLRATMPKMKMEDAHTLLEIVEEYECKLRYEKAREKRLIELRDRVLSGGVVKKDDPYFRPGENDKPISSGGKWTMAMIQSGMDNTTRKLAFFRARLSAIEYAVCTIINSK